MASIGTETGTVQSVRVLDGCIYLPLPSNKLPELGGVIPGGCYEISSVFAEADGLYIARMTNSAYAVAGQRLCLR